RITGCSWTLIDSDRQIGNEKNATWLFDDMGEYKIGLTVWNEWGCTDTVLKTLVVLSDVKLFVPTAFSPNNDGLNETFKPKGRGIVKYLFEIYNRWGEKIFVTDDFEEGWDGMIGGMKCANDIYVWKIFATDVKAQKHDLTGHVTLFR
ncbi:MAG TPA: gliding motility-associated C-terminal domain-containing protein, partial [Bacteroidia bacterium]|nr:gliding motility-associated C-terminal domain-containing protein [Bacteroidia bacterium]